MNRILLIIMSISLLMSGCVNTQNVNNTINQQITYVIDAGHGGKDCGTVGIDGALEKNINLSIATILYDFLNACGINAILIRNGDYEIYKEGEGRTRSDLYNRLDFVNSIDNSRLISIHQNHFENEKEHGCQIWYSANTDTSKIMADSILKAINENTQKDNKRQNKASDNSYYILYKATVPSIMIECGFMSNYEENKNLQDTEYQTNIAFSVLEGICEEI